jgi:hypothetical protein
MQKLSQIDNLSDLSLFTKFRDSKKFGSLFISGAANTENEKKLFHY